MGHCRHLTVAGFLYWLELSLLPAGHQSGSRFLIHRLLTHQLHEYLFYSCRSTEYVREWDSDAIAICQQSFKEQTGKLNRFIQPL